MKRLVVILICIFLILVSFLSVKAEETEVPEDVVVDTLGISAPSAILIDAKSQMVLYEKDAYAKLYPASITKILTVYLACENLDPNQIITCSSSAIYGFDRASSHIFLDVDEQIAAIDLMYAAIMESANDASCVLAEAVSGSIDEFVKLMNDTVAKWGLTNTHFANPHGLNDENHYTCAYDMAIITKNAMSNELFKEIFGNVSWQVEPNNKQKDVRYFSTGNYMLKPSEFYYEYATGGKIGYTKDAGYTMVTTASKDNMDMIAVVMNCEKSDDRYTSTRKMFDYGFSHYKTVVLDGNDIGTKEVEIYSGRYLWAKATFSVDVSFNVLLPSDKDDASVSYDIEVKDDKDPDLINAYVVLYLDGERIGEAKMDKDLEIYDISFENTTAAMINRVFDYFCIGVLALFVGFHFLYILRKYSHG